MSEIIEKYSKFYKDNSALHVYPVEIVVRTLLGTYPNLNLDRTRYRGSKILDLGFGDGRNFPLLNNLGFEIFGVEISDEIVQHAKERMSRLAIKTELSVGSNAHIPYDTSLFDYLLACYSCYYVETGTTFQNNLEEMARVLKKDGYFLGSVGKLDYRNYLLQDVKDLGDGHFVINTDLYSGVRNNCILRFFKSEEDIIATFSKYFTDFTFSTIDDNYYGLNIVGWFFVCKKK